MRILGFRPTFWPTVITAGAVLLAVGLGTWQVQRLFWKEGLIAARQANARAPVLDKLPATFRPDRDAYRRVTVEGRYLNDKEIYLAARSHRGNAGFHVVTPFALAGGGHILVDRGWVPLSVKEPIGRAAGQIDGPTKLTGYMRLPSVGGYFTPDNEPSGNIWYTVDIPAIGRKTGIADLKPFYLERDATPMPGGFPVGGQTRLDLPNNHLQYVVTWYALAIIGLVIYILYHRRREREMARRPDSNKADSNNSDPSDTDAA